MISSEEIVLEVLAEKNLLDGPRNPFELPHVQAG